MQITVSIVRSKNNLCETNLHVHVTKNRMLKIHVPRLNMRDEKLKMGDFKRHRPNMSII